MDPRTTKDILRRLRELERRTPRLRRGVVTGTSPLDVALGGSEVSYTDVAALASVVPEVGDAVSVIVSGHELLVIGVLA